jgi:hypothetical protein
VDFHFTGVNKEVVEKVPVAHARWIGRQLSRLTDGQLAAVFSAANYTPAQRRLLARAFRARVNELLALPQ